MAKPFRKALARLQQRQKSYDSMRPEAQRTEHRPGSMKKSGGSIAPRGSGFYRKPDERSRAAVERRTGN